MNKKGCGSDFFVGIFIGVSFIGLIIWITQPQEPKLYDKTYYVTYLTTTPNGLEIFSKYMTVYNADKWEIKFSIDTAIQLLKEKYNHSNVVFLNFQELDDTIIKGTNYTYEIVDFE